MIVVFLNHTGLPQTQDILKFLKISGQLRIFICILKLRLTQDSFVFLLKTQDNLILTLNLKTSFE